MAYIRQFIALGVAAVAATSAPAQILDDMAWSAASTKVADQDAALNAVFKEVSAKLNSEGRKKLIEDQRQWLRKRNSDCGLLAKDTISSQWPRNLSTEDAECVVRVSKDRTQELRDQSKAANPSLDEFSDKSQLLAVEEFTLPMGHTSGKWYAEVTIDRDVVESAESNGFYLGVDNVNGYYAIDFGKLRLPPDQSVEVIGLMVDLDNRLLDWRTYSRNFSGRGVPMFVNEKPYAIKLKAKKNLEYWLSRGKVRINYGQTAFKYPTPAGFSPWYYSPVKDDPSLWFVPPYERVERKDTKQIAYAFWDWLINRGGAPNPTQDRTGAECAVNQKGSFWFLAGAQTTDRVERSCSVPYGVNVVVPVISLLLSSDDSEVCKNLVEVAQLSPYTIQDSFLEIDGRRFDRLQDYSASVYACSSLVYDGKQLAKHANWLGLWVPLRPLPRGTHTITFGGRINAVKTDRQVTYKLIVQ